MSTTLCAGAAVTQASVARRQVLPVHPNPNTETPPRCVLPTAIQRRTLLSGSLGLGVVLSQCNPVQANQSDGQLKRAYYENTAQIIREIKDILALGDSLTADENLTKLQDFKKNTSAWVGNYRRLVGPGQISYSTIYSVISALLGYFTTVGLGKKALPQKVRDSQSKRVAQAEVALQRELKREGLPAISV